MTPALAHRRIVVTRPETDTGPLSTALRRAGAEAIVVPLVGISPVPGTDHEQARRPLREFNWIAFTSANGVRMFAAGLDAQQRTEFRQHRGIAAVGPATARAIAEAGATSSLTAPEFVAEALADAIGDVNGMSVLWPRAAGARSLLAERLRDCGAEVVEQILYDTVALPIPQAARERVLDSDAITFTSPSAVRAFAGSFPGPVRPRIVCIGPVTTAAARDAGLDVAAVAAVFDFTGLVSALTDMFAAAPAAGPQTPVLEI
jgi:uroporphyrinogen-III synthase